MIESIKNTSVYKSLSPNKFNAYLLYSNDKELNNNVALSLARFFMCENQTNCGQCNSCKQFIINSHPDVVLLNQNSIKVEDVNVLTNKLSTKPIYSNYKLFVILNAETINEIAQNKLLKSLEEHNQNTIFILTTTKTDKLLPTILSRLNKIYIPKLTIDDKILIAKELKTKDIDIFKYINSELNLTEMLNLESNKDYLNTINEISTLLHNLKTTQDIPKVVSSIKNYDKNLFLPLLQDLFISCLNLDNKFDKDLVDFINSNYNKNALSKCIPLIADAYKKQMANVNFSYILDNLLFNILKEKFLCR